MITPVPVVAGQAPAEAGLGPPVAASRTLKAGSAVLQRSLSRVTGRMLNLAAQKD
ncbi:MAG: hypothetical protein AAF355_11120 [Myxococcota bacterium]